MSDDVNHPEHYQNIAGVEAIDILNDVVKDLPGKQASMLWNTLKYLFRFQKKNGVEDLKKAQNYLKWLIDITENGSIKKHPKDMPQKQTETLQDTWYSNEYKRMWLFSKSSEPDGKPSKLIFETRDAAEEFTSVLYNMISEGYTEFSIADVALEMKFKFTKGNKWNKWDELVYWDRVLDSFSINEDDSKYELIFNYKVPDSRIIYESNDLGSVDVFYSANMYPGMCTTILFDSRAARKKFSTSFFQKLTSATYQPFSIRDVLSDISVSLPEETDYFSEKVQWKNIFTSFALTKKDGKYALVFYYKDDDLETSENDSHIVYKSTVYGSADIYYSKELLAGTCTRILFDDKDGRQTFMIKFFRHLRHCKNDFSIQDVMLDNTYRFHKDDTEFCIYVPWNEIFAGFRMYEEGGQYVLEFVYENDNSEPLLDDEWYAYF